MRAFAHQLGVPLELEIVDLTKGAQRKPEYLALNPTGRTPTLVDGDFKLVGIVRDHAVSGSQKKSPLWPDDAKVARRHRALAKLAPAALEPRDHDF